MRMELQPDDAAARGLRRYVHLVGAALGLTGDGSCLELDPPVSAYLALDKRLPRFPNRDAALLWDERHGWALAIESHSTEDLLVQAYLGIDVLPAPRVVARFATRLLQGEDAGQPDAPDLRAADAKDDLPHRLAAYAHPTWAELEPVLSASDLFTVRAERHGPRLTLHVSGEVDLLTAQRLQESITHALDQDPELLILDLTDVRFLGSAGIAVLIEAQEHNPTRIRIVADAPAVIRPLKVVGLVTRLSIYPTMHAALADPTNGDQRPRDGRSRPAG